ncbi:MAG: 16S rRNA (guanine(527)-N(7))-methyltransferase RsmG [Muribaculaceae bacterium]|nr:16S rRNA (guanine(527)-N(7))-methyltransferase RsmG [Muribaculaceae bacterium]
MVSDNTATLLKYFPSLTESQLDAFSRMEVLYTEWNAKINVVSRADIGNIFSRHILHSLAIAAFFGELKTGTEILDLGTGGGFPGIPLAVMYPECHFHLIDRIGKKIKVASEIATAIGLRNVTFQHGDAGECHKKFDYVVSRAVMTLDGLVKIAQKNTLRSTPRKNRYSPGLVCLKGGNLDEEIAAAGDRAVIEIPVTDFFNQPDFETKEIIYVPL